MYSLLTTCRFGEKQFSAAEKLARRGWSIWRDQITDAVIRCNDAISSHRSLKCSLKICLAAMKSEYHFATYDNRPRSPCKICGFPETIYHIYNQLFCASARFILVSDYIPHIWKPNSNCWPGRNPYINI